MRVGYVIGIFFLPSSAMRHFKQSGHEGSFYGGGGAGWYCGQRA